MPFAAAWSCHPQPASALGECLGQLLEDHGPHPDLAVLFVTPDYSTPGYSTPDDSAPVDALLGTIATLLAPAALMAVSAEVLLVDSQRIEHRPALALWAGWDLPACRAVRLELGTAVGLLEWIEQGDPATGPNDPCQLAEKGRQLQQVAEREPAGHPINRAVPDR